MSAVLSPAPGVQDIDLDDYFARIGHSGPASASIETLKAIQVLHPTALPFEAMDVLLDRGVRLDPASLNAKLVHGGRGGYCFEHNGLLLRVLQTLGFQVEPLLARVRWQQAADAPPPPATHMVLRVIVDGAPWLVDVGFGASAPTAPLRLDRSSPQATPHETFRLRPQAHHGWLLEARLEGAWTGLYEVLPEPRVQADLETANWYTSTHPSSHFRHNLTVARTTADGRVTLRDDRLTVRRTGREVERRYLTAAEIETELTATFGLRVESAWRPAIEAVVARARRERAAAADA